MKVVIIAGGLATRLHPISATTPKCLVDVFGKPLLQWGIDLLKKQGFTDFIFCIGHRADQIHNYFKTGEKFGINIKYVIEERLMGTAGAVKQAEKLLDDNFLVFYGDNITTMNFRQLIIFHNRKESLVTLCLRKAKSGVNSSNIITMDSQAKINIFLEKPNPLTQEKYANIPSYINNGMYICKPSLLKYIPVNTKYDFSYDLFPNLLKRNIPIAGYSSDEFFRELGRTEKYIKFTGNRTNLNYLI